jgi:hypothetical protein
MMGMIAIFATAGPTHYRPTSTLAKSISRHLGAPATRAVNKFGSTYVALLGDILTYHDTSLDSLATFAGKWDQNSDTDDPRESLTMNIAAAAAAASAQDDWSKAHPEIYTPWHALSTIECYEYLAERIQTASRQNGSKRTHRALLRAFSTLRVPAANCIGHVGDELLAKYTLASRLLAVHAIRVVGSFDSFVMQAGNVAAANDDAIQTDTKPATATTTVDLVQRNLRDYFALTPPVLGKHVHVTTDLDIDMLQVLTQALTLIPSVKSVVVSSTISRCHCL